MRLKSGIWVAAYLRRCNVEGVFAAVRRRGAEEAGAIFIKINRLDGTGVLYGPAAQAVFDDARPADRVFEVLPSAVRRRHRIVTSKRGWCAKSASILMYGLSRWKTEGAGIFSTTPSATQASVR